VVEKQASSTIRPLTNGWSRSIPVSRMATVTPLPVQPAALAPTELTTLVLVSREALLSVSSYTDLIRESLRSSARVGLSISAMKKLVDPVLSSTRAIGRLSRRRRRPR